MLKRQMAIKRQLSTALAYTTDADTVEKILTEWKNKDVVKPQDLAMSWYFTFLHHEFTQESASEFGVKLGMGQSSSWRRHEL